VDSSTYSQGDGQDVREHPLSYRMLKVGDGWLRYSESFTDGSKLLAVAERIGLEVVVSKMWVMPYRSGSRSDWVAARIGGNRG